MSFEELILELYLVMLRLFKKGLVISAKTVTLQLSEPYRTLAYKVLNVFNIVIGMIEATIFISLAVTLIILISLVIKKTGYSV